MPVSPHEGLIQCAEQQRPAWLLRNTVIEFGPPGPGTDYPLPRALLL